MGILLMKEYKSDFRKEKTQSVLYQEAYRLTLYQVQAQMKVRNSVQDFGRGSQ